MAMTFVLDIPDGTVDQLDEASKRLSLGSNNVPEGQIAHVEIVLDGGGVRIIDVWDSEEAFGRFMQEKIGPLIADGVMPNIEPPPIHQVHRVFVAPIGAAAG
jgi:hypothetical protein